MLFPLVLLTFLGLLATPSRATKWLIDNPGFNSPDAWESGYPPCALEEVLFPEYYPAVLPLPATVNVSGFILPRDGAILLNDESTISIGGDLHEGSCENGRSQRAELKPPLTRKWYDPLNWRSSPADTQNSAIPQMERVPCQNESVVIQRQGPISIDLEYVPFWRMGHMNLAGSLLSSNYLRYLLTNNIGQVMFQNSRGVRVEFYNDDICGCQQNYPTMLESICHNVLQRCERPHCLVPVTPLGYCCAICGATLQFSTDYCSNEDLHKLRKVIAQAIKDQNLLEELDYHINYVHSPPHGTFLQAIIVDRDTYNKKSVDFVQRLNASTDWVKLFNSTHKMQLHFAGKPYNPNITFGSVLLIILCLLLVSVVALVIFAHYAPDHPYLRHIPRWVYDPNRWRAFLLRSSVMFARFDNAPGGGRATEDEHHIQESIIMGYDAASDQVRERAFDNPMFGEKQQKKEEKSEKPSTSGTSQAPVLSAVSSVLSGVKAQVAKAKEQKPSTSAAAAAAAMKSSGTKLENVSLVDAMEGDEEEQELTEIKLDNSSDEEGASGNEQETKE